MRPRAGHGSSESSASPCWLRNGRAVVWVELEHVDAVVEGKEPWVQLVEAVVVQRVGQPPSHRQGVTDVGNHAEVLAVEALLADQLVQVPEACDSGVDDQPVEGFCLFHIDVVVLRALHQYPSRMSRCLRRALELLSFARSSTTVRVRKRAGSFFWTFAMIALRGTFIMNLYYHFPRIDTQQRFTSR